MAVSDKNILITPNISSTTDDPKIVFSGADANTAAQNITLKVYPTNNGTLSFEGSAGQLFSITNSLTGTIFSVNDITGIPSIEVIDTGLIKLAQYSGNVVLGSATDNGTDKLQVNGSILATTVKGSTLQSTVATGTAPLSITSTTAVTNLNADLLDGNHSSAFAASSHTHSYAGSASAGGAATTALKVENTVAGTNSAELVRGNMGDNDFARVLVGATASNAGYLEIATADDGTEPIYVRQYTGTFGSLTRTATLLDSSGNTSFPGTVTAPTFSGSLSGNAATATNVAASGITGQTGMWTSSARPGPYRLYRNDDNSAYNVQITWQADRSNHWSLRGYSSDTYHAPCYVAYSGYADSAGSAPANGGTSSYVTINYNNDTNSTYQMLWGSGNGVYGTGGIYCNPYTDTVYATTFTANSDPRLKDDITPINSALNKILNIGGYKFKWKPVDLVVASPGTYDYGVLSTEIEKIAPELVTDSAHKSTDGDKYKTVSYDKLIPFLVEAIKEQQTIIESQNIKIERILSYLNIN